MDFLTEARAKGLDIKTQVQLAPFTTWKIGGPAKFFLTVRDKRSVVAAVKLCHRHKVSYFPLGHGSNILVSDRGFDALVIHMQLEQITVKGTQVTAESGVTMGRLAVYCMQHDLTGLEWAVGLPGTMGGAIFGNSNSFGGSTGDYVQTVEVVTPQGEVVTRPNKDFKFAYDFSRLQKTRELVLAATFRLQKAAPKAMNLIRKKVATLAAERAYRQPLGEKTAGSTFKAVRPTQDVTSKLEKVGVDWRKGLRDGLISAGFIIDQCLKLKGYTLNKMQVSTKHANFFVNLGSATAENARNLIDFVKKECKNILGVTLTEEIQYVGKF